MKLLSPTDFGSIKKMSKFWWDLTTAAVSGSPSQEIVCVSQIKAVKATETGFKVLFQLMEKGHQLFSVQFTLLAQLQLQP